MKNTLHITLAGCGVGSHFKLPLAQRDRDGFPASVEPKERNHFLADFIVDLIRDDGSSTVDLATSMDDRDFGVGFPRPFPDFRHGQFDLGVDPVVIVAQAGFGDHSAVEDQLTTVRELLDSERDQ